MIETQLQFGETPREARENAILQSDAHANPEWRELADSCIEAVAARCARFSADEVWEELERRGHDITTHQPSALGPVFLRASRQKMIVKSGATTLSKFSRRHRDLTIWRSLIAPESLSATSETDSSVA